ncbi:MAG: glycoside hydrolase family 25 protein [Ruminococcus sp.]|nr:glycoside hydrolase family 25 protein [Oscillospiraceae bacterium]
MMFTRKIFAAAISCSLAVTYVLGTGMISAEEQTPAVTESVQTVTDIASETTEAEETTLISAEPTSEGMTLPSAEPVIPEAVVTEPQFNVFDIYDAYMDSLSQTKPTETTQAAEPNNPVDASMGIYGIDVSKWQSTIDWDKVKADGVNYAIIRAGYGKLASQEDPMFDTNMINAEKAGIQRGVYWYSYATTVEEAYQEAEACYSVIKGYKFEYPLVFDIEDPTQVKLSTATVSAIIDAFCSRMQEKGYYVSLYSYSSFLNTKVYSNVLDKYNIFVAHFNVSAPNFSKPYGMWQYSSTGRVNGITTDVDLDYAYIDYPYIIKRAHCNGY